MLAASQGAQAHSLTRSRACWSQPALDGGRLARRGLLRAGVAHRPAWRGTAGSGGGAGAYQPWQPQLPPTEASLTEASHMACMHGALDALD